ncbi:MAG TPA: molecular chaperone DnaJ [Elusimicrobia bacterium]|nr:MAG: hypothetical protein A2204_00210 [Elusimicrobia bacterium RIFOXYA1_FULL_47_7]OGS09954.1 MAG: hypothetical protein A2386_01405 [Elusimicrobia bacterium RIFOXYB1_FULL_48_9]OGS15732.1 MAG: hypothetical protein A2251_08590 [Elusimicrobia bacterium RIFOXYA2_FULL_47_53]OGS31033.1 MAG: hypothetical protein A2323_06910 [Elusimicrobia bacterium RIFOXYB2_FULL_46_23]HBU70496.1 molecular chaperone DnaJ [Elusimicrobiota bacterium]
MINYKEVDEARKLLGLPEEANIKEIKEAYRQLALECHPDRCRGKSEKICEERFKGINAAHKLLLEFCENYRYRFTKQVVDDAQISGEEKEYRERFYGDWL